MPSKVVMDIKYALSNNLIPIISIYMNPFAIPRLFSTINLHLLHARVVENTSANMIRFNDSVMALTRRVGNLLSIHPAAKKPLKNKRSAGLQNADTLSLNKANNKKESARNTMMIATQQYLSDTVSAMSPSLNTLPGIGANTPGKISGRSKQESRFSSYSMKGGTSRVFVMPDKNTRFNSPKTTIIDQLLRKDQSPLFGHNVPTNAPNHSVLSEVVSNPQQMNNHPINTSNADGGLTLQIFNRNDLPVLPSPLLQEQTDRHIAQHNIYPQGKNSLTSVNARSAGYDYKRVIANLDIPKRQYDSQPEFAASKKVITPQYLLSQKEKATTKQAVPNIQSQNNGTGTIHFNKSLIEHFTINVSGTNDGITDFKRKVEEVLLEILNSVNTH